jgi:hypothetical protein
MSTDSLIPARPQITPPEQAMGEPPLKEFAVTELPEL